MKGNRFTGTFVLLFGVLLPAAVFSAAGWLTGLGAAPPKEPGIYLPVLTESGEIRSEELETYLVRVLLAEIPEDFSLEALKAQAVAARTLAAGVHLAGDRHPGGAVCTDPECCQPYSRKLWTLPVGQIRKVRQAVRETAGQVLTYEGALIRAESFPCSGGKTEAAAAVWGVDVPYLQATDSPGEAGFPQYIQTVTFSADAFAALLPEVPAGLPGQWLGGITYTEGGGVDTLRLGGKTYRGAQLRQLLGLPSTAFVISIVGNTVTVTAKGCGHRVGMSRCGAEAMALQGSTYEQILTHYYRGAALVQGWTLPSAPTEPRNI